MGKFDNRGGFGEHRGGSERRDSRGGGFNRGGRDAGRAEMHSATCSECGRTCEVPFKPTGDKPVYCSECFKTKGGAERRNFGERDFSRRPSFEDKKMFRATCSECGQSCEVPFKPTGDKPVYCSECFGQSDKQRNKSDRGAGDFSKRVPEANRTSGDFNSLNAKLDKILQILSTMTGGQPRAKEGIKEMAQEVARETVKEAKEIVKDVKAKVTASKKTVVKAVQKAATSKVAKVALKATAKVVAKAVPKKKKNKK